MCNLSDCPWLCLTFEELQSQHGWSPHDLEYLSRIPLMASGQQLMTVSVIKIYVPKRWYYFPALHPLGSPIYFSGSASHGVLSAASTTDYSPPLYTRRSSCSESPFLLIPLLITATGQTIHLLRLVLCVTSLRSICYLHLPSPSS